MYDDNTPLATQKMRLKTFENIKWRAICDLVYDNGLGAQDE